MGNYNYLIYKGFLIFMALFSFPRFVVAGNDRRLRGEAGIVEK